jgi:hypothetical protein
MKVIIATVLALASHAYAYSKQLQGQAMCQSSDNEAIVNIYSPIAKLTPKEVQAFVNKTARTYGVDTVDQSTVIKSSGAFEQSFFLSNSITSYAMKIQCTWTKNLQY